MQICLIVVYHCHQHPEHGYVMNIIDEADVLQLRNVMSQTKEILVTSQNLGKIFIFQNQLKTINVYKHSFQGVKVTNQSIPKSNLIHLKDVYDQTLVLLRSSKVPETININCKHKAWWVTPKYCTQPTDNNMHTWAFNITGPPRWAYNLSRPLSEPSALLDRLVGPTAYLDRSQSLQHDWIASSGLHPIWTALRAFGLTRPPLRAYNLYELLS